MHSANNDIIHARRHEMDHACTGDRTLPRFLETSRTPEGIRFAHHRTEDDYRAPSSSPCHLSAAADARPITMALVDGQLAQFEQHCERLYTSPDANERATSEAALVQLSSSIEYIPQCQFVLDNSSLPCARAPAQLARVHLRATARPAPALTACRGQPHRRYAQLVAANALKKLLLQSWNQLTSVCAIGMRAACITVE